MTVYRHGRVRFQVNYDVSLVFLEDKGLGYASMLTTFNKSHAINKRKLYDVVYRIDINDMW